MARRNEHHVRKFPEVGDIFAERYRIESVLGVGGFARVYRGVQFEIERPVAVKILSVPAARNASGERPTSEKRFYREARLLSRLRGPTTVQMYDYGRTPEGLLFMVFELVEGETISDVLEREGRFAPERVTRILKQVLQSLREAHSQGILHRDIKPANVMLYERLGERDQVKVLDFGIAKSIASRAAGDANVTVEGGVVGTPRYMSPEQVSGRELTAASDLFSAGLVAYEMLVGAPAVSSGEFFVAQRQLLDGDFRLPDDLDVPKRLRQVIEKLLRQDPGERYERCREALSDLGVEVSAESPRRSRASRRGVSGGAALPAFLDSAAPAPASRPVPAPDDADELADTIVSPPPTAVREAGRDAEESEAAPRRWAVPIGLTATVTLALGITAWTMIDAPSGDTAPDVVEPSPMAGSSARAHPADVDDRPPVEADQPREEPADERGPPDELEPSAPDPMPAVRSASIFVRASLTAASGASQGAAEANLARASEQPEEKRSTRRPRRRRDPPPKKAEPKYDFKAVDDL